MSYQPTVDEGRTPPPESGLGAADGSDHNPFDNGEENVDPPIRGSAQQRSLRKSTSDH